MAVLWHSVLLGVTAWLAAGLGLWMAAILAVLAAVACYAIRGVGASAVRGVAFLGAVAAVVSVGLKVDGIGVEVLVFAALFAVQLGAFGAAVVGERRIGAGPLWSTLVFYSALLLAFLVLSAVAGESLSLFQGASLAAVIVASGLMLWREGFGGKRFREMRPKGRELAAAVIAGAAGVVALLAALVGLFSNPLPWAGERAMEMGSGLRAFGEEMADRWSGKPSKKDREKEADADRGDGSPDLDFGRRRELPERAQLEQSGEALVHVRIDDRVAFDGFIAGRQYLRSWVLERYVGDAWDEPESVGGYLDDGADGVLDGWVTLAPGEGIEHRVFLPDAGGAGLPAIQNPLGFGLSFLIESAPDMYEAELRGSVFYDVVSAPKLLTDLEPDRVKPGKINRPHLTQPGDVQVGILAREIIGGRRGTGEELAAIGAYLRTNFRYTTTVENPDGLPPLRNFLFGEQAGWCDFFATAAVLLAREAGFPARMAYGFSGGQAFVNDQVVSYRESDAHAWAEVFVEGEGWVVLDATPTGQGAARSPSLGGDKRGPELSTYRPAEDGDLAGQAKASERSGMPEWLGYVLVCLATLLVGMIAWRIFAKREDDDSARDGGDDRQVDPSAPGYLKELIRLCLEVGRPKPKGETLRETVAGLGALGLSEAVLPAVAEYHYAVRYEAVPRDKGREGDLRRELKQLRKAQRG